MPRRTARAGLILAAIAILATGCTAGAPALTFRPATSPSPTTAEAPPRPVATPTTVPVLPRPSGVAAVTLRPRLVGPAAGRSGSATRPGRVTGSGGGAALAVDVPILYYHRIAAPPPDFRSWSDRARRLFISYDVIPAVFEAQLDWLVARGFTTILPRDLAAHWDAGAPLPARPVILTFDDGSKSWMRTVLPMLKARGMVAEFYLTLDAIENGNLTWEHVRRLAAAGNGIGTHGVHHVQLTALGNGRRGATKAEMLADVTNARRIVGENIGVYPDSMAYVGGGFDDSLVAAVQTAGYTTARSILRGLVQTPARRFTLRVVPIRPHDDVVDVVAGTIRPDLPTFAARMNGTFEPAE